MLRDILNRNLVKAEPNASVIEIAQLMTEHNVGAVLIARDGKPLGIVTDRDIVIRCLAEDVDFRQCKVEDIMTDSVETCRETDGIFDCIQKMRKSKVRRMPVIDPDGRAIGIISFGDLLAVLSKEFHELISTTTPAEDIEQLGEFAA